MGKIIVFIFVFLGFLLAPLLYLAFLILPDIKKGDQAFEKAQEGETVLQQYIGYNEALSYYLKAENRSPLLFRDYRLALRSGEALYALHAYPSASYYFWTAYNDHPSQETKEALSRVLAQLKMTEEIVPSPWLPISYTIISAWSLLFLLAFSIVLRKKSLMAASGTGAVMLTGYLFWLFYYAPLEGIVLRSQPIVSLEGKPSSFVLEAGSKVELLGNLEGLVKVRTEQGVLGYLPPEAIRALR